MNLPSPVPLATVEFNPVRIRTWSNVFDAEKLTVLGAIGVVILPVLFWAVFIRKRRRRRSHHHYPSTHSRRRDSRSQSASEPKPHRRRRRHRQHRNPTLAETGGLPPARSQAPQETASQETSV